MEQAVIIIMLTALVIGVLILSVSLINLKLQINRVTGRLKAILKGETKELVTISLGDKNLECLTEAINDIVIKYSDNMIDIKRQEERLKENISCLSHDLRTPLTSIRGYLQLLESSSEEKSAEYIKVLHKKAVRLGRLIEDYYQISLLDNQNFFFEYEVINISDLLTEILLENYSLFAEKELVPEIDIPQKMICIYADRTACVRIIQNLIFNTLDETSGDMHIQLAEADDKVCLTVKNPVNNFALSELDRIFERFYMKDKARRNGHSGQGLYVVKKLLTEMKCDEPQVSVRDNCFSISVKWKMV
ncbi:MAG: HAMP domain-containing histidine kinase [Lachnospiraceae bacterium]|nr:HAMP domain-containing histidine kinase [Lachnospiraceae bacterium]